MVCAFRLTNVKRLMNGKTFLLSAQKNDDCLKASAPVQQRRNKIVRFRYMIVLN
jgi:hypothetical protein